MTYHDPQAPAETDAEAQDGLTTDELQDEQVAELPDREAMSLLDLNAAAPVNVAAALNVLSDDSVAYANAEQNADITQSN